MAMMSVGHTPCAICGVADFRPYTATSGCAFPESDELWRYCDAPLHLDCLALWDKRIRFSRGYFDMRRDAATSGLGLVLSEGPDWMLRCGPATPSSAPYYVEIDLAEWPMRLYSKWGEWAENVNGGLCRGLVGPALHAAEQAVAQVRAIAPDAAALNALRQRVICPA